MEIRLSSTCRSVKKQINAVHIPATQCSLMSKSKMRTFCETAELWNSVKKSFGSDDASYLPRKIVAFTGVFVKELTVANQ